MGGRNLFLVVSAFTAVGTIQQQGALVGLGAACVFGALVWLIVWPIWLLTEAEPIVARVRRLPGWLVVVAWPVAAALAWVLEPDHGFLVHRGPLLFLTLPAFWLLALGVPMLTVRWFKLRRSTHSTPPA
jgi:hypothetical protein